MEAINLVLELIQIAFGKRNELSLLPSAKQWEAIKSFACRHALAGVFFLAIEKLPTSQIPDKSVLMTLFAQAECYKRNYTRHQGVAKKLSKLWNTIGVESVVLKGQTIAQYYPRPELRFSCDLDLFVQDGWQNACRLLEQEGIALEYEVYKEAEFEIDNVYVELHRFITPVRGNKNLHNFELFLRDLLSTGKEYFDESLLVKPPLMFVVMLYVEHALGDFLKAHLSFKHIVDWVVLRNLSFDRAVFQNACKRFGFDRFLVLLDNITDVVEGRKRYEELSVNEKQIFDELISQKVKEQTQMTWFKRRVDLFFEIIANVKRFNLYGYCSMHSFLFNAMWSHFFQKEVKL